MKRKDLQDLTLVGLIWENPVPDPLAVQDLDNRLFIKIQHSESSISFVIGCFEKCYILLFFKERGQS